MTERRPAPRGDDNLHGPAGLREASLPAAKLISIFPTPVSNTLLADAGPMNDALEALILELANTTPSLGRSNVGGWHSGLAFLERTDACIAALRQRIEDQILSIARTVARDPSAPVNSDFRLEGWANVLPTGGYNAPHSHPNAFWSGVYYINGNPAPAEDDGFSGKLELMDPRPGASVSYADHTTVYGRFLVNPKPGQLVIFPGWLQHMVHPYRGAPARITVAFNATYPV